MELQAPGGAARIRGLEHSSGHPAAQGPQGRLHHGVHRRGCRGLQLLTVVSQAGQGILAAPVAGSSETGLERFGRAQRLELLPGVAGGTQQLAPATDGQQSGQELVLGVGALGGAGGQCLRSGDQVVDAVELGGIRFVTHQHSLGEQVPVGAEQPGQ